MGLVQNAGGMLDYDNVRGQALHRCVEYILGADVT